MGYSDAKRVLIGVRRSTTRKTLILAVGLFIVSGGVNIVGIIFPDRALILAEINMNLFYFSGFGAPLDVGMGVILITGLALVHAYFNEGFIPSILLATAPYYASYLFTVTGPRTGIVWQITDNLVFAPTWAAIHVLPNAIVWGTMGFLVGIGLRYLRRRRTVNSISNVN